MNAIRQFLKRVKTTGVRRRETVKTVAMGRERTFEAYDIGDDTFIIARGVSMHLADRPSVLVVEKSALRGNGRGYVMTISTGNHSVAAFPLLDGRFWKLSRLQPEERGMVLMRSILCANVVGNAIEISQRDVSTDSLVRSDEWLMQNAGFSMADVVMSDRNEATLDYYRRRGQEWRVKPLAWTEAEMRCALDASKKRIASGLWYFHSARGVHFLSFSEFSRFAALARTDEAAFLKGLKELTAVFEGNQVSFTRMIKFRGHHEIELFGLKRGDAMAKLIPELEKLMEAVALGKLGQLGVIARIDQILELWKSLLARPELADDTSKVFTETLYMYITGEIYAIVGEGSSPAFDDRRTALPGATFTEGRFQMHPGADERTEILMSNLRGLLSQNEVIEYANVYELRSEGDVKLGSGSTREIVYKTNMRPLEASLIEKGLSHRQKGYSQYMLARIGALRSLGISLSSYYRLLRRRAKTGGAVTEYYIRRRCEGEPMDSIPASYFRDSDSPDGENHDIILGLATLLGDAAAQNMAMKKFDPRTESPLFGIGKEIYDFEYDILREAVVPKSVSTCSIRGSFGWPNLEFTDENLREMAVFYFTHYAHALKEFQKKHKLPMQLLADCFMSGFEFRTHAMEWQLSVMRDKFEEFHPDIPKSFDFERKWKFIQWSLERQDRRLLLFQKMFYEKVDLVEKGQ